MRGVAGGAYRDLYNLQHRGHYDVVVVGGGIMGSSTAHHLATTSGGQLRVAVVEPDPTYNTSATTLSVGGLRQQFSLPENIRIGLQCHVVTNNGTCSGLYKNNVT